MISSEVTANMISPFNESIQVTYPALQPPRVSVRAGASSLCELIYVQTCLGPTTALINLTLPAPIEITVSADRYVLVPATNVADLMGNRRAYAQLTASILFADGQSRTMQTDPRVTFSVSHECGAFSESDGFKRLTVLDSCRTHSISVTAVATMGGSTVSSSRTFTIEWLAAVQLEAYYQDGTTKYTSSQLRHRYACTSPSPTFHSLRIRTFGVLSSGSRAIIHHGVTYSVSGASLSNSGHTRTLVVSSAGAIVVTVTPDPNPDGVNASLSLVAVAEADSYIFDWSLGLSASTVRTTYLGYHPTSPMLMYSSGYSETVAPADRPSLIVFDSSDTATLAITNIGQLQARQNSPALSPVQVSAQFCDGTSSGPSTVFANLQRSAPFDYDLGNAQGAPITNSEDQSEVCIPVTLYSASVLAQFQFVLRFDSSLLDCTATSCGSWTPGSAWTRFGSKVGLSRDAGQVDFATVASVSSLNMAGDLDIGTLCLDVIGSGLLTLQVQMKVHIDTGGTRTCNSGSHLYQDGTRCYSRTPQLTFPITCSTCARQLAQQDEGEDVELRDFRRLALHERRRLPSSRPRPMNIDDSPDQLTMADCLFLTATQQELAGFEGATRAYVDSLDADVAISYNPNLDFYVGSTTPMIDSQDAVYCINYVLKKWRFAYNVSLE